MKLKNIQVVTDLYHSSKGNDYCIVKLELDDIDEKSSYKPVMYGTISYKDFDHASGRLTRKLNLFSVCLGKTISDAIQEREDCEAIEGKSLEETIEYFASK